MKKLNARQQKFIELYEGNGTDAARRAGYTGSDTALATTAMKLLRKAEIAAAIEKRNAKALRTDIADRQERQAFWSKALRDPAHEMRDRLKASELLGKSEADFTEKVEHLGSIQLLTDGQIDARLKVLRARDESAQAPEPSPPVDQEANG